MPRQLTIEDALEYIQFSAVESEGTASTVYCDSDARFYVKRESNDAYGFKGVLNIKPAYFTFCDFDNELLIDDELLQQYYSLNILNLLMFPLTGFNIIPKHQLVQRRSLHFDKALTHESCPYWMLVRGADSGGEFCQPRDMDALPDFAKPWLKYMKQLGFVDIKKEHVFIDYQRKQIKVIDLLLVPGADETSLLTLNFDEFNTLIALCKKAKRDIESFSQQFARPEFISEEQHQILIRDVLSTMQLFLLLQGFTVCESPSEKAKLAKAFDELIFSSETPEKTELSRTDSKGYFVVVELEHFFEMINEQAELVHAVREYVDNDWYLFAGMMKLRFLQYQNVTRLARYQPKETSDIYTEILNLETQAMLRFGSGNAARGNRNPKTGVFPSAYCRSEFVAHDLTSRESLVLSHKVNGQYPIIANPAERQLLAHIYPERTISTIKFSSGELLPVVWAEEDDVKSIIKELARLGLLPSRDIGFSLYEKMGQQIGVKKSEVPTLEKRFISLFEQRYQDMADCDYHVVTARWQDVDSLSLQEILRGIDGLLKKHQHDKVRMQDEQRPFYWRLVSRLLCISDIKLTNAPKEIYLNAIKRILLNLKLMDTTSSYHSFLRCVELIIDDYMLIMPLRHYSKDKIKYKEASITESALEFFSRQFKFKPTHVMPFTSGMHSLVHSVAQSVHQARRSRQRTVIVHSDATIYFELDTGLKTRLKKLNIEHGQCSTSSGYADVICTHFDHNVQLRIIDSHPINVSAQIQYQLDLRSQYQSKKPLFAIIDLTLTELSDVRIQSLIKAYQEQINSGQLVLQFCISFNKFFSCGTDRTSCAYQVQYFKIAKFSLLAQERRDFLKDDGLMGVFTEKSPTMQLVARLCQTDMLEDINMYQKVIRQRAKLAYQSFSHKFSPDDLFQLGEGFFTPECDGIKRVKPFIYFQAHTDKWPGVDSDKVKEILAGENCNAAWRACIGKAFYVLGIPMRAGFGFPYTSFVFLDFDECGENRINFRLTPGTESEEAFLAKMDALTDVFAIINHYVKNVMNNKDIRGHYLVYSTYFLVQMQMEVNQRLEAYAVAHPLVAATL